jgi:hypothetical protein
MISKIFFIKKLIIIIFDIVKKVKPMETVISKKELIDWISSLEDEKMLLELSKIKRNATFNFDEEFKKGIPLEEFRERMLERVRSYPWKNDSISK